MGRLGVIKSYGLYGHIMLACIVLSGYALPYMRSGTRVPRCFDFYGVGRDRPGRTAASDVVPP
eukprot:1875302-Prymnesium_polylepis.1